MLMYEANLTIMLNRQTGMSSQTHIMKAKVLFEFPSAFSVLGPLLARQVISLKIADWFRNGSMFYPMLAEHNGEKRCRTINYLSCVFEHLAVYG